MGAGGAAQRVSGLTLDACALMGVERGSTRVRGLLRQHDAPGSVRVPATVLAQVWRSAARQAELHRFLATRAVEVVPFDADAARFAGGLLASTGTSDVIDASVVVCAWQRDDVVLTSDPADLRRLDPTLRVIAL